MRRRQHLWKGMIAGLAGGLAGTIAMTIFQTGWTAASRKLGKNQGTKPKDDAQTKDSQKENEDSTVKVATRIASIADIQLATEQKQKAGSIVHYGFGSTMGLVFGSIREIAPRRASRHAGLTGLAFGTLVFLGADEIVVPALSLSDKPAQKSASEHLYELSAHVVYGLTAGFVTKTIRDAL